MKTTKKSLDVSKRLKKLRSGLEDAVRKQLEEANKEYEYETHKLQYVIPESIHTYIPDFVILKSSGEPIFIECKGHSGITRIDINIDLYSNNTQNSTSVSYSADLSTSSEKEVIKLTDLYVAAVEEVFGGTSDDNTQTK